MRLGDIDEVMEIEQRVFPSPWSDFAYKYELTQNDAGHYLVVRKKEEDAKEGLLLGYGGFWLVADEAHISTLAVRPGWRRRGIGELVLVSLLDWAIRLGADVATLEVRVSNVAAQNLYLKYGFRVVGRRKEYYSDNREDALIMSAYRISGASFQARLCRLKEALWEKMCGKQVPVPVGSGTNQF